MKANGSPPAAAPAAGAGPPSCSGRAAAFALAAAVAASAALAASEPGAGAFCSRKLPSHLTGSCGFSRTISCDGQGWRVG